MPRGRPIPRMLRPQVTICTLWLCCIRKLSSSAGQDEIAELGVVAGHEFREGNATPAAGNLAFMQTCERNMPRKKKITAIRADSAAYQAAIFNWWEETGKVFAIGANQDTGGEGGDRGHCGK
jgi:hypothetical protein